jgi:hypothetical protein
MLLWTRAPLTLRGIISVAALYGGVVLLLGISTPALTGELSWGEKEKRMTSRQARRRAHGAACDLERREIKRKKIHNERR